MKDTQSPLDKLHADLAAGATPETAADALVAAAKHTRKRKPKKRTGRNARWEEAAARCRRVKDQLDAALSDLRDLQAEYQEVRDNLTENLASSTFGEKLDAVCDLDLDLDLSVIDEADGMDLPLGFGRD